MIQITKIQCIVHLNYIFTITIIRILIIRKVINRTVVKSHIVAFSPQQVVQPLVWALHNWVRRKWPFCPGKCHRRRPASAAGAYQVPIRLYSNRLCSVCWAPDRRVPAKHISLHRCRTHNRRRQSLSTMATMTNGRIKLNCLAWIWIVPALFWSSPPAMAVAYPHQCPSTCIRAKKWINMRAVNWMYRRRNTNGWTHRPNTVRSNRW